MERRTFIAGGLLTTGSSLAPYWFSEAINEGFNPQEISSLHGHLTVTLLAQETMIPYQGGSRWAMTYNGIFPGPTLRVNPGDTLAIKLINKLSEPTNLHTHGLHTSPNGNGDNPFLMINPGESFSYVIKIPQTQMSGTFWYHPHHHELSAAQVSSGLAGAIIVEDGIDQLGLITKSTEKVLVLADPRIGNNRSVSYGSRMDSMMGRTGPHTLVNGLLLPTIHNSSSLLRLRVVNSCVTQYQNLRIPGVEIFQISSDSSRLTKPVLVESIQLTSGQRSEFFVSAKSAGKYLLRSESENLAILIMQTPTSPPETQTMLPVKVLQKVNGKRLINITGSGMGMMGGGASYTFDGRSFDPHRIDQRVHLNSIEDWVISNHTHMHHPFHIHVWPFQVIDDGSGRRLDGWHDTVNVPAGSLVRIRIPFTEISGKTVYHCHILDHEDSGMMGIIQVT